MTPRSRIRQPAYHRSPIQPCSGGEIWQPLYCVVSWALSVCLSGLSSTLCVRLPLMVLDPEDLYFVISSALKRTYRGNSRHVCSSQALSWVKADPKEGQINPGGRGVSRWLEGPGSGGLHVCVCARPGDGRIGFLEREKVQERSPVRRFRTNKE
jgi:hypothetical protein